MATVTILPLDSRLGTTYQALANGRMADWQVNPHYAEVAARAARQCELRREWLRGRPPLAAALSLGCDSTRLRR